MPQKYLWKLQITEHLSRSKVSHLFSSFEFLQQSFCSSLDLLTLLLVVHSSRLQVGIFGGGKEEIEKGMNYFPLCISSVLRAYCVTKHTQNRIIESSFITILYVMLAVNSAFLYQRYHDGCYLTFNICGELENFFCGEKWSINTWLIFLFQEALILILKRERRFSKIR